MSDMGNLWFVCVTLFGGFRDGNPSPLFRVSWRILAPDERRPMDCRAGCNPLSYFRDKGLAKTRPKWIAGLPTGGRNAIHREIMAEFTRPCHAGPADRPVPNTD